MDKCADPRLRPERMATVLPPLAKPVSTETTPPALFARLSPRTSRCRTSMSCTSAVLPVTPQLACCWICSRCCRVTFNSSSRCSGDCEAFRYFAGSK
eukprot:5187046-Prymnesium_polylepis.2